MGEFLYNLGVGKSFLTLTKNSNVINFRLLKNKLLHGKNKPT